MSNYPVTTFGNVPQPSLEDARAAVISVPLEASVSYGEGTALGPAFLMLASANMELYDEVLDYSPVDRGIWTDLPVDVSGGTEEVLARITERVGSHLDAGRLPALLGGEHTVTLGALRALVDRRGPDFTVLSLDAHLDMRESYEGDPLSHACVMRRAWDMGLSLRWLGARSCSGEEAAFVREKGLKPTWAHLVHSDPHWLDKAVEGLSGPVYLTLDLDGLDSSLMPGTGTPEPGGLFFHHAAAWLEAVFACCQVIGLDVVELAPIYGQPASDFTAARLLYRALGLALRESE